MSANALETNWRASGNKSRMLQVRCEFVTLLFRRTSRRYCAM